MLNKLRNDQGIRRIVMKPQAMTCCELGGDWYSNDLLVVFDPEDYYPDYTEVQEWVMENIDGKTLNIEDVVQQVHDMLMEFRPRFLEVKDRVENCKTHFDVVVIK